MLMSGDKMAENCGWRNAGNQEGYRRDHDLHDYRTSTRNNSTGNYSQNRTCNDYNRPQDGNWRSNIQRNASDQQWHEYDSRRPRWTQSSLNLNVRSATPPGLNNTAHNNDDIVKSYACIPPNDVVGQIREVYLQQFESKDLFTCRLKDDVKLEEMLEEMQRDCNAKPAYAGMLKPGEICCAKYSPHGRWYRVMVLQVEHGEYDIFDVDFGITGKTMCSSVRGMKRKFGQLPVQAFQCYLEAATNPDWNDETNEWLLNLIKDRELFCWFKGPHEDSVYPVALLLKDDLDHAALVTTDVGYLRDYMLLNSENSSVLSGDTVEEQQLKIFQPEDRGDGTATCSTHLKYTCISSLVKTMKKVVQVVISWVESEYDFYCHLKMYKAELDELNDKLQTVYNGEQERLTLQQLTPATPCVAKFPEDELWYRAEIKKVDGSEVEVIFVDYGNVETIAVDDLRQITEEFVKLPAQALHCVIPTPNHGKKLTYEDIGSECAYYILSCNNQCYMVEESNSSEDQVFIDDQNVRVESRFVTEDDNVNFEAKLEDTGSAELMLEVPTLQEEYTEVLVPDDVVTAEIGELCTAINETCIIRDLPRSRTAVYMLDPITSPIDFWVQIEDHTWNLSETVGTVEDIPRIRLEHVTEGTICASTYNNDGSWYRAKVITKDSDSTSTVLFIDYGNQETKPNTELYALDSDIACFPPLAVHCRLSNIVSGNLWTPEAVAKFEELTGHYGKTLLAEFSDSDTSPVPVRLLDCGIDVAKTLASLGFCTYSEPGDEECAEEYVRRHRQDVDELAFDGTEVEDEISLGGQEDENPESVLMYRNDEPIANVDLLSESDQDVPRFLTKVYIIEPITSPVDFWAQIEDDTWILSEKVGAVEYFPRVRLETVTEGMICASTFNDDGAWYRAQVITKDSDTTSTVLFIDYGNRETKQNTELHALDNDIASFPPLAVHCQLSGIVSEGPWTPGAVAKFEELTGQYEKSLLAEFFDSDTSPVPVRLLYCDNDVAKTLASLGFCTYLEVDDEEFDLEKVRSSVQDESFLVSSPAGRIYNAEYNGSSFCEDVNSSESDDSEEGFVGDAEDESTIGSDEDTSTASQSSSTIVEDKDAEAPIDVICVEGDEEIKYKELDMSEEEFFSSCETSQDDKYNVGYQI